MRQGAPRVEPAQRVRNGGEIVNGPRYDNAFRIATTGTEADVRAALAECRARLPGIGVSPDMLGSIELVMAEALNNIAEHAYAGLEPGPMIIEARRDDAALSIRLCDRGHALPGGALPAGRLPDSSGPRDTLPEGGFGWFLIRDLTSAIAYNREGGENRLDLTFSLNQAGQ